MERRTAIVLLIVAVLATDRTPIVVGDAGLGELVWHDDEALLFVGGGYSGFKFSNAWLAMSMLSAFGPLATDGRSWVDVIRITSTDVSKHRVDPMKMQRLTVIDGHVSTGPTRWTGERFEPASGPLAVSPGLTQGSQPSFSNVDGWSKATLYPWSSDRTGQASGSGQWTRERT